MVKIHFPDAYDLSTLEARCKVFALRESLYACKGGVLLYPEGIWIRKKEIVVYLTRVWQPGWTSVYPFLLWDPMERATYVRATIRGALGDFRCARSARTTSS